MHVVCVDVTDVGAEFILAHSFTMPSLKMQIRQSQAECFLKHSSAVLGQWVLP